MQADGDLCVLFIRVDPESPVDESLRILDGLIQAAHARKAALKRGRNSAVLIEQLPDEILLVIFKAFCYYDEDITTYYKELRVLRLVCHRWAHLILSSPTMWNEIPLQWDRASTNDVIRALENSNDAVISIHARLEGCGYIEEVNFVLQVLPHAGRWSGLYLETEGDAESFAPFLTAPAAGLKTLELQLNEEHRSPLYRTQVPLFAHTAVRLNTLTLTRCTLPWDSIRFDRLTSLTLTDVPIENTEIIRLLCGAPVLARVSLAHSTTNVSTRVADTTTMSRILLPHLKVLWLDIPFDRSEDLLNRIKAQGLIQIYIRDANGRGEMFDIDSTSTSAYKDSFLNWTTQVAALSSPREVEVRLLPDRLSFTLGTAVHQEVYKLPEHIIPEEISQYLVSIFHKLVQAIPSACRGSITGLRWTCFSFFADPFLTIISKHFPNIQHVQVTEVSGHNPRNYPFGTPDGKMNRFPDLQTLRVGAEVPAAWFRAFLQFRSACKPSRIEIVQGAEEQLALFRELADNIAWVSVECGSAVCPCGGGALSLTKFAFVR